MGRGLRPAASNVPRNPKNKNLKNKILQERQYQTVYLIDPSGEISLRTPLMTGTLEFLKTN